MKLKILVTSDKERGIVTAAYPPIPGCHAEASTEEEALRKVKLAIQEAIGVLNKWVQPRDERDKTVELDL